MPFGAEEEFFAWQLDRFNCIVVWADGGDSEVLNHFWAGDFGVNTVDWNSVVIRSKVKNLR